MGGCRGGGDWVGPGVGGKAFVLKLPLLTLASSTRVEMKYGHVHRTVVT